MDISWLTQEAHNLHNVFVSVFYTLISTLLLLGIVLEYFKFPLGLMPSFAVLVGRAFIAVMLLISYNEIANNLGAVADSLAQDLGSFDNLDLVLQKMGEKVDNYSVDWLNARSWIVTALSILTYTLLFYSVIIAEVAHIFTWTLLYVFAPILIALFVLPATASATKALFRSLVEVACWKIVWATLASLLWASVLIEMNSINTLDFIKMICINLILGGSLLATPLVVHALGTAGLAGFTRNFTGIATAAGFLTPMKIYRDMKRFAGSSTNAYRVGGNLLRGAANAGIQAGLFARNPVRNTTELAASAKKSSSRSLKTANWILSGKNKGGNKGTQDIFSSSTVTSEPITPGRSIMLGGNASKTNGRTSWQRLNDLKRRKEKAHVQPNKRKIIQQEKK